MPKFSQKSGLSFFISIAFLKQEIAFDKEMSEKREMTNEEAKALEEITSKNEEVCL